MTDNVPNNALQVVSTLLFAIFLLAAGCSRDTEPPVTPDTETEPQKTDTGITKADVRKMFDSLPTTYPDADYVEIPNTGISLVAPPSLVPAERFYGFKHDEVSASVMISTTPVPFPTTTRSFILDMINDTSLNFKGGFTRTVDVNGQEAVFAFAIQEIPGGQFCKHILAFGDEQRSWVVTGIHPIDSDNQLTIEILESVMSTRWNPAAGDAPIDVANVDFEVTAPTMKRSPGWTKAVAFTKDGVFPLKNPTDPFFKVSPSVNKVTIDPSERRNALAHNLAPSPDTVIEHLFIDREITVDGLPGREMMALANDNTSNTPILLYCAMLFDEDSYVLMQGWVGQSVLDDYTFEFKEITRSFKRGESK